MRVPSGDPHGARPPGQEAVPAAVGVHDPQLRGPAILRLVHVAARVDDERAVGRDRRTAHPLPVQDVGRGQPALAGGLLGKTSAGDEQRGERDTKSSHRDSLPSRISVEFPTGLHNPARQRGRTDRDRRPPGRHRSAERAKTTHRRPTRSAAMAWNADLWPVLPVRAGIAARRPRTRARSFAGVMPPEREPALLSATGGSP